MVNKLIVVRNISKMAEWGILKTYLEEKLSTHERNLHRKEYTSVYEMEADRSAINIYRNIINIVEKGTDK